MNWGQNVETSARLFYCLVILLAVIASASAAKESRKEKKGAEKAPAVPATDYGNPDEFEFPNAVDSNDISLVTSNAVSFDGRSLLFNGTREIIFCGSIHYPRSLPEMWPDLIKKGKDGGLNCIESYVFWNGHEPEQGKYNFEGRFDMIRFIKEIQKQGMRCILRLGPFIQSEWNYGGFPYWLREVPDMTFRTDNIPFKYHMRRFLTKIVDMLKEEKLFAPQGGPIILSQVENEYNMVQGAYRAGGDRYVRWVANLALNFKAGIPWVMCKQMDAPGPMINACNGRHCADNFAGPNSPTKPFVWTENWTAQYRTFGDPPSQRSAEDMAYGVARFFTKNGSLVNYYMYHGGTNWERSAAAYVSTRYYDEAPLDEFGLLKEPKYGHMRELHNLIQMYSKTILYGDYSFYIGKSNWTEATTFQTNEECIAFLCNQDLNEDHSIDFRGKQYELPKKSISILPDCENVAYMTGSVTAQHNSRTFISVIEGNEIKAWEMYNEKIPTFSDADVVQSQQPHEHWHLAKDKTDYVWFFTTFHLDSSDLPRKKGIRPFVQISCFTHVLLGFSNDECIGDNHGYKREMSFMFVKPLTLKAGPNQLTFLSMTVGLPDGGAYLERRHSGLHTIEVKGLNTGTVDLTRNNWGHKAGMYGEKQEIFTEDGVGKVKWLPAEKNNQVTWYKRRFDNPRGDDPVVVDMSTMAKGTIWINGRNIGRYWVSHLGGRPSQWMYHVPRSYLKEKNNLIVVFEEMGGDPSGITFYLVKRDNICGAVSESQPGDIKEWKKGSKVAPKLKLACPPKKFINSIAFADFGNPTGMCGEFRVGNCSNPLTMKVAEKECVGKNSCKLEVGNNELYGAEASCHGNENILAVQAKCSKNKKASKEKKEKKGGEEM